jgi:hypothetical protein
MRLGGKIRIKKPADTIKFSFWEKMHRLALVILGDEAFSLLITALVESECLAPCQDQLQ